MRIWLDPDRLSNMLISTTEVITAIQQENLQAAAGKVGAQPVPTGQAFEYPITVKGRLTKAAEFEEIIVRRNDDGSIVRVRDVARVELSSENYDTAGYLDGKPAGAMPVYQYADANALNIVGQVKDEMNRLKKAFPEGLDYAIAYDTTKYVSENITGGQGYSDRGVPPRDDRRVHLPPRVPRHASSRCWRSRSRWSPPSRRWRRSASRSTRSPSAGWSWRSAWWSTTRSSWSKTSRSSSTGG